jgi:hypothetical protein
VSFDPSDVEFVVRARTPGSEQPPLSYESSAATSTWAFRPSGISSDFTPLLMALGVRGAFGVALALHAQDPMDPDTYQALPIITQPQSMPSHKLDLHLRDGSVLQIDGDKFGFRILGAMRAMSDNVNIDRMCELFVHLNSNVVVDTYFGTFLPPTGHHRLKLPMMHLNDEHMAFAFYSRWCALMYRHVING